MPEYAEKKCFKKLCYCIYSVTLVALLPGQMFFCFAGIVISGYFLAQPDSPGFTGFSFSRRGGQERMKERERKREKEVEAGAG